MGQKPETTECRNTGGNQYAPVWCGSKSNKKELKKIVCNCCGKELTVKDGIVREGVFSAELQLGPTRFEKRWQRHILLDLCEECYDKWISGFQIPVGIQE